MQLLARLYDRFARQGMGRALRHRHFRVFTVSDFGASLGMWVYRVGAGWLVWELSHSGLWLGIFSMAGALPLMVLLPFTGAIADRVDRVTMLKATQVAGAALAATLTTLTFTGLINVPLLVLFGFLFGVVHPFVLPARMTMPPNLVPKEDLNAAIGVNGALYGSARFLGPAAGGFIISLWGVGYTFSFNLLTMGIFFAALTTLELRASEVETGKRAGLGADVLEGIRYAFGHASLGPLLTLVIASSILARPFMELFPGFNDQIFHQGPEGLGTLLSTIGLGGIAGSFWVANFTRTKGLLDVILTALLVTALLLLVYSVTDIFWLAVLCVLGIGFTMGVWQSASQVAIHGAVEGRLRARVMSIYALTYRAGPSLGALFMGTASTYFGLQTPVAAGAVLCLVALALFAPRRARVAAELEAAVKS